jgi:putative transposase
MPYWRTFYHLIWATHQRRDLISVEVERYLYPLFFAKARELDCTLHAVNGWQNHVHLVLSIPPKIAVADVVSQLKGNTSYRLNHEYQLPDQFSWQRGYGVLTLGERQLPVAIAYVQNQKEHHTIGTTIPRLEKDDSDQEQPQQSESITS